VSESIFGLPIVESIELTHKADAMEPIKFISWDEWKELIKKRWSEVE